MPLDRWPGEVPDSHDVADGIEHSGGPVDIASGRSAGGTARPVGTGRARQRSASRWRSVRGGTSAGRSRARYGDRCRTPRPPAGRARYRRQIREWTLARHRGHRHRLDEAGLVERGVGDAAVAARLLDHTVQRVEHGRGHVRLELRAAAPPPPPRRRAPAGCSGSTSRARASDRPRNGARLPRVGHGTCVRRSDRAGAIVDAIHVGPQVSRPRSDRVSSSP